MESRRLMFHAQIGYRDPEQSRRAWAEIYEGCAPDRYGICLDWSMGYPAQQRRGKPRGTGLILDTPEAFRALTQMAPVAPHFGDFVMGTPAALENTAAALQAGATIIGNLGQYFTFRLPHWDDDVETTLATVRALGLIAAQKVEVLVHSNLDDGFAAWFSDLASALGAATIERYVVEELVGARVAHCFGHTFGDPVTRLAFQRALAVVNPAPGSMLYGNTTAYGPSDAANYGALASYLLVDLMGQATQPSGHAVNPVPVTEAQRIPAPQEVVAAHRAGRRLAERLPGLLPLFDQAQAMALVPRLLAGAEAFKRARWMHWIAPASTSAIRRRCCWRSAAWALIVWSRSRASPGACYRARTPPKWKRQPRTCSANWMRRRASACAAPGPRSAPPRPTCISTASG